MRNIEVVQMFVRGTHNHKGTKNLHIESNRLINYNTTLAEWKPDGTLVVNTTKYSVSTSKIQTYIRNEVCGVDDVRYVENQRQGVYTL